jgi:hypothetical protein
VAGPYFVWLESQAQQWRRGLQFQGSIPNSTRSEYGKEQALPDRSCLVCSRGNWKAPGPLMKAYLIFRGDAIRQLLPLVSDGGFIAAANPCVVLDCNLRLSWSVNRLGDDTSFVSWL